MTMSDPAAEGSSATATCRGGVGMRVRGGSVPTAVPHPSVPRSHAERSFERKVVPTGTRRLRAVGQLQHGHPEP